MVLDEPTLLTLVRGAVGVTESAEGLAFERMTPYLKTVFSHTADRFPDLPDDYFRKNCDTDAGIMLDFFTDSAFVTVDVGAIRPANGSWDVTVSLLVDNAVKAEMREPGRVTLPLPGGIVRVTVMFPYFARAVLRSVELSDGCSLSPRERKGLWVFHGDSITHGCLASTSAITYVGRIARESEMEVLNLGSGGYVHDALLVEGIPAHPADGAGAPGRVPDVITVAYGINDVGRKTPAQNKADMTAFYAALTAQFPTSRIFMISPIFARMMGYDEHRAMFDEMYAAFREVHAAFADRVTYIDGRTLVPNELKYLSDDGVHPNDAGFEQYAKSLRRIVEGE